MAVTIAVSPSFASYVVLPSYLQFSSFMESVITNFFARPDESFIDLGFITPIIVYCVF